MICLNVSFLFVEYKNCGGYPMDKMKIIAAATAVIWIFGVYLLTVTGLITYKAQIILDGAIAITFSIVWTKMHKSQK